MRRPRKKEIGLLAMWDLAWKALAVYVALKNGQRKWVLPLAVVGSGGILPIVYLIRYAERPAVRE